MIKFPPLNTGISITQVLDVKIDIPITGLFLEVSGCRNDCYNELKVAISQRGLAGVVGPFQGNKTAALQIYDWRSQQGILLDTGIELQVSGSVLLEIVNLWPCRRIVIST
jgi:hypothetical protein